MWPFVLKKKEAQFEPSPRYSLNQWVFINFEGERMIAKIMGTYDHPKYLVRPNGWLSYHSIHLKDILGPVCTPVEELPIQWEYHITFANLRLNIEEITVHPLDFTSLGGGKFMKGISLKKLASKDEAMQYLLDQEEKIGKIICAHKYLPDPMLAHMIQCELK